MPSALEMVMRYMMALAFFGVAFVVFQPEAIALNPCDPEVRTCK